MFQSIRNSFSARLLWGFIGLNILNISIDTPDKNAFRLSEDLSVNDQESLVELIVESVLGYEDAMPEFDDPDHNLPFKKKIDEPNWRIFNEACLAPCISTREKRSHYPFLRPNELKGHTKISTPPPKIV